MKPQAKILLIGGAEDIGCEIEKLERRENVTYEEFEIIKTIYNASKNRLIYFITTGTRKPERTEKRYSEVFKRLDLVPPTFKYIQTKEEANSFQLLKEIEKADVIFFTGGDQSRLTSILLDTHFSELVKSRSLEDKDLLIAGTSAGAMFLSKMMIVQAPKTEVLLKHRLKMCKGLELLPNCIIDTHFIKRGRFSRLAHAVITHSQYLGIGLGEDTAIFIEDGKHAKCLGSGMVITISAQKISESNIAHAKEGHPIYIKNLSVDILVKGSEFLVNF